MQNVIIIEDNTRRQQEEYNGISLNKYGDIVHNAINEEYQMVFNMLKKKVFELPYDIVIVHESAFEGSKVETIDKLKQYCKAKKKMLVFFSGGIDRVVYNRKIGVLYLPSQTMYKNLMEFLSSLKNGEVNIEILAYGKNWKINSLNSVFKKIKKLTKEIKSTNKIRTKIFKKEVGFDLVEALIPYSDSLNKDFLEVIDLEKIMKIIKVKIKDEI